MQMFQFYRKKNIIIGSDTRKQRRNFFLARKVVINEISCTKL